MPARSHFGDKCLSFVMAAMLVCLPLPAFAQSEPVEPITETTAQTTRTTDGAAITAAPVVTESVSSLTNNSVLDLSSTVRSITTSTGGMVNFDGGTRTINPGELVTPAEHVALGQLGLTGQQAILLSPLGNAVGGAFQLNHFVTPTVSDLIIPENVSAVHDFGVSSMLSLSGNLTNSGSLYAISTNNAVQTATISSLNIFNQSGALISSILPSTGLLGFSSNLSALNLNLIAQQSIVNAGTISSAANLVMTAPNIVNSLPTGIAGPLPVMQAVQNISFNTSNLVNTGAIAAATGNINIAAQLAHDISVSNIGGKLEALSGMVNVRDSLFEGMANTSILGGDIISRELNVFSGTGKVDVHVKELTGALSIHAAESHVSSTTETLNIGEICISGDPTFYNAGGNIYVSGSLNFSGAPLALVASRDIVINPTLATPPTFSINTSSASTSGGAVTMIAGAAFTVSSGGNEYQTDWGGGDTVSTLRVYGPSGTGGKIDLRTGGTLTSINTSSSAANGNGGNVTLVAYRGTSSDSGAILLPSASTIQTGGSGTGFNGNVQIVGGADNTNSISVGSIDTRGGSGAASGNVEIRAANMYSVNAPVTIVNGAITAGAFDTIYNTTNASVSVQNISAPARQVTLATDGALTINGSVTNNGTAAGISGGNIDINAGTLNTSTTTVLNANGFASAAGTAANGGQVTIRATNFNFGGSSGHTLISANANTAANGTGNGGKIQITAGNYSSTTPLTIGAAGPSNGSIELSARGGPVQGNGGDISVTMNGNLNVDGNYVSADPGADGHGEKISLNAGYQYGFFEQPDYRLRVYNAANLADVSGRGSGNGGTLELTANNVTDPFVVGNATVNGIDTTVLKAQPGPSGNQGGTIKVQNGGGITVLGGGDFNVRPINEGQGGTVQLLAYSYRTVWMFPSIYYGPMVLPANTTIDASGKSTFYGGGTIEVAASTFNFNGTATTLVSDGQQSPGYEGNGGTIKIQSNNSIAIGTAANEFRIFARGAGDIGDGGSVTLNGNTVTVNPSGLNINPVGTGKGGSLTIYGASVAISNDLALDGRYGPGGTIKIQSSDLIANNLYARGVGWGSTGGTIDLYANTLQVGYGAGTTSGVRGYIDVSTDDQFGGGGTISLRGGTVDILDAGYLTMIGSGSGIGGNFTSDSYTLKVMGGIIDASGYGGNFKGGNITVSFTTLQTPVGTPLTLWANAAGSGNGGTINVRTWGTTLEIGTGQNQVTMLAYGGCFGCAGGNGGTLQAQSYKDLFIWDINSFQARPLGLNGDGAKLRVIASNGQPFWDGLIHDPNDPNDYPMVTQTSQLYVNGALNADAVGFGNGGEVQLYTTQGATKDTFWIGPNASISQMGVNGAVTARGGPSGGDGGKIQIYSANWNGVVVQNINDFSAAVTQNGKGGTIILDGGNGLVVPAGFDFDLAAKDSFGNARDGGTLRMNNWGIFSSFGDVVSIDTSGVNGGKAGIIDLRLVRTDANLYVSNWTSGPEGSISLTNFGTGGTIAVRAGVDLFMDDPSALQYNTTSGMNLLLEAGNNTSNGRVQIGYGLEARGSNGGAISIISNSSDAFYLNTFFASNYVAGTLDASATGASANGNGGSVTIVNRGTGGIQLLNPNDISVAPGGASGGTGGSIRLETLLGPLVSGAGTLNASASSTSYNGGSIYIDAGSVSVAGGNLSLQANGANGGSIAVYSRFANADLFAGPNSGQFSMSVNATSAAAGKGNAGNILLYSARNITFDPGAGGLSDTALGNGNGANISVLAPNGRVQILNTLTANAAGNGTGGNIYINYYDALNEFVLDSSAAPLNSGVRGSLVATAPGTGSGGTITIDNWWNFPETVRLNSTINTSSVGGYQGSFVLTGSNLQPVTLVGTGSVLGGFSSSAANVTVNLSQTSGPMWIDGIQATNLSITLGAASPGLIVAPTAPLYPTISAQNSLTISSPVIRLLGNIESVNGAVTLTSPTSLSLYGSGTVSSRASSTNGVITIQPSSGNWLYMYASLNLDAGSSGGSATVGGTGAFSGIYWGGNTYTQTLRNAGLTVTGQYLSFWEDRVYMVSSGAMTITDAGNGLIFYGDNYHTPVFRAATAINIAPAAGRTLEWTSDFTGSGIPSMFDFQAPTVNITVTNAAHTVWTDSVIRATGQLNITQNGGTFANYGDLRANGIVLQSNASASTLQNFGTIQTTPWVLVANNSGTTMNFTNSGTISPSSYVYVANNSGTLAFNNTATIYGPNFLYFESYSNQLSLTNSGTITTDGSFQVFADGNAVPFVYTGPGTITAPDGIFIDNLNGAVSAVTLPGRFNGTIYGSSSTQSFNLTASGGTLDIGSIYANLQISLTNQNGPLNVLSGGSVFSGSGTIVSLSANGTVSVAGSVRSGASPTTNGYVSITANSLNITPAGSLNANAGTAAITAYSNNTAIGIADSADGNGNDQALDINAAELQRITAGTLMVGDMSARTAGGITIQANMSQVGTTGTAGIYNLSFLTSGNYNATGRTIDLGTRSLVVQASGNLNTGSVNNGSTVAFYDYRNVAWPTPGLIVDGNINSPAANVYIFGQGVSVGAGRTVNGNYLLVGSDGLTNAGTLTGGTIDLVPWNEYTDWRINNTSTGTISSNGAFTLSRSDGGGNVFLTNDGTISGTALSFTMAPYDNAVDTNFTMTGTGRLVSGSTVTFTSTPPFGPETYSMTIGQQSITGNVYGSSNGDFSLTVQSGALMVGNISSSTILTVANMGSGDVRDVDGTALTAPELHLQVGTGNLGARLTFISYDTLEINTSNLYLNSSLSSIPGPSPLGTSGQGGAYIGQFAVNQTMNLRTSTLGGELILWNTGNLIIAEPLTANGFIYLDTANDLTVNADITANAGMTLNIPFVADKTVTIAAGTTINANGLYIQTDHLNIAGNIVTPATSFVWIQPNRTLPNIVVGDAADGNGNDGRLDINSAELSRISTGLLHIGLSVRDVSIDVIADPNVSGPGPFRSYDLLYETIGNYSSTGVTTTLGNHSLTVLADGTINTGGVTGGTSNIYMASGSTLNVNGPITLTGAGSVSLYSTRNPANNPDVNIGSNVGGSLASVFVGAGGAGNINWTAPVGSLITGASVSLSSSTGSIGSALANIRTAAANLYASTSTVGSGSVYITEIDDVNITGGTTRNLWQLTSAGTVTVGGAITSGAGGTVSIASNGGNINYNSASNSSILLLGTNGGTDTINMNASPTAGTITLTTANAWLNSAVGATTGDLLIQRTTAGELLIESTTSATLSSATNVRLVNNTGTLRLETPITVNTAPLVVSTPYLAMGAVTVTVNRSSGTAITLQSGGSPTFTLEVANNATATLATTGGIISFSPTSSVIFAKTAGPDASIINLNGGSPTTISANNAVTINSAVSVRSANNIVVDLLVSGGTFTNNGTLVSSAGTVTVQDTAGSLTLAGTGSISAPSLVTVSALTAINTGASTTFTVNGGAQLNIAAPQLNLGATTTIQVNKNSGTGISFENTAGTVIVGANNSSATFVTTGASITSNTGMQSLTFSKTAGASTTTINLNAPNTLYSRAFTIDPFVVLTSNNALTLNGTGASATITNNGTVSSSVANGTITWINNVGTLTIGGTGSITGTGALNWQAPTSSLIFSPNANQTITARQLTISAPQVTFGNNVVITDNLASGTAIRFFSGGGGAVTVSVADAAAATLATSGGGIVFAPGNSLSFTKLAGTGTSTLNLNGGTVTANIANAVSIGTGLTVASNRPINIAFSGAAGTLTNNGTLSTSQAGATIGITANAGILNLGGTGIISANAGTVAMTARDSINLLAAASQTIGGSSSLNLNSPQVSFGAGSTLAVNRNNGTAITFNPGALGILAIVTPSSSTATLSTTGGAISIGPASTGTVNFIRSAATASALLVQGAPLNILATDGISVASGVTLTNNNSMTWSILGASGTITNNGTIIGSGAASTITLQNAANSLTIAGNGTINASAAVNMMAPAATLTFAAGTAQSVTGGAQLTISTPNLVLRDGVQLSDSLASGTAIRFFSGGGGTINVTTPDGGTAALVTSGGLIVFAPGNSVIFSKAAGGGTTSVLNLTGGDTVFNLATGLSINSPVTLNSSANVTVNLTSGTGTITNNGSLLTTAPAGTINLNATTSVDLAGVGAYSALNVTSPQVGFASGSIVTAQKNTGTAVNFAPGTGTVLTLIAPSSGTGTLATTGGAIAMPGLSTVNFSASGATPATLAVQGTAFNLSPSADINVGTRVTVSVDRALTWTFSDGTGTITNSGTISSPSNITLSGTSLTVAGAGNLSAVGTATLQGTSDLTIAALSSQTSSATSTLMLDSPQVSFGTGSTLASNRTTGNAISITSATGDATLLINTGSSTLSSLGGSIVSTGLNNLTIQQNGGGLSTLNLAGPVALSLVDSLTVTTNMIVSGSSSATIDFASAGQLLNNGVVATTSPLLVTSAASLTVSGTGTLSGAALQLTSTSADVTATQNTFIGPVSMTAITDSTITSVVSNLTLGSSGVSGGSLTAVAQSATLGVQDGSTIAAQTNVGLQGATGVTIGTTGGAGVNVSSGSFSPWYVPDSSAVIPVLASANDGSILIDTTMGGSGTGDIVIGDNVSLVGRGGSTTGTGGWVALTSAVDVTLGSGSSLTAWGGDIWISAGDDIDLGSASLISIAKVDDSGTDRYLSGAGMSVPTYSGGRIGVYAGTLPQPLSTTLDQMVDQRSGYNNWYYSGTGATSVPGAGSFNTDGGLISIVLPNGGIKTGSAMIQSYGGVVYLDPPDPNNSLLFNNPFIMARGPALPNLTIVLPCVGCVGPPPPPPETEILPPIISLTIPTVTGRALPNGNPQAVAKDTTRLTLGNLDDNQSEKYCSDIMLSFNNVEREVHFDLESSGANPPANQSSGWIVATHDRESFRGSDKEELIIIGKAGTAFAPSAKAAVSMRNGRMVAVVGQQDLSIGTKVGTVKVSSNSGSLIDYSEKGVMRMANLAGNDSSVTVDVQGTKKTLIVQPGEEIVIAPQSADEEELIPVDGVDRELVVAASLTATVRMQRNKFDRKQMAEKEVLLRFKLECYHPRFRRLLERLQKDLMMEQPIAGSPSNDAQRTPLRPIAFVQPGLQSVRNGIAAISTASGAFRHLQSAKVMQTNDGMKLIDGDLVAAASQSQTIRAGAATIAIPSGSIVLISQSADGVTKVRNLHGSTANPVKVTIGGRSVTVMPVCEAVVGANHVEVMRAMARDSIGRRGMEFTEIPGKCIARSEYSCPTLFTNTPLLLKLFNSKETGDKRMVEAAAKTAVCFATVTAKRGPYSLVKP